jgi:hypothetical protein
VLKARVPQPPICGAKTEGKKRQRGSLFFGFFLLAKQKKETRMSRESDYLKKFNKVEISLGKDEKTKPQNNQ